MASPPTPPAGKARAELAPELAAELATDLVQLAVLIAAAVLIDPVTRRNLRVRAQAVLAATRRLIDGPPPPTPTGRDVANLHDEARRITREASRDATT